MRKRVAGDRISTAEANRRRAAALAELREIQVARERGRVVEIDDAVRVLAGGLAILRSHLLGLGAAVAPQVTACATAAQAQAVIDERVSAILTDLSGYDGPLDLGEVDAEAARIVRQRFDFRGDGR